MKQHFYFLIAALISSAFCHAEEGAVFPDLPLIEKVKPTKWIGPNYPVAARKEGVCGFVEVALAISESGVVEDARIITAQPSGYFEQAVLESTRKWVFEPLKNEGVTIKYQTIAPIRFLSLIEGAECNPNKSSKANGVSPRP